MRVNSAYDACISCENFVKFGSVTPELTGLICERPKNWRILFNISGSTGPISAIVAPYESALHADDGFVAYFPIYQGTLPWKPNNVAIMKLNWYYVHSLHVCQMAHGFGLLLLTRGSTLRCRAGYLLWFAAYYSLFQSVTQCQVKFSLLVWERVVLRGLACVSSMLTDSEWMCCRGLLVVHARCIPGQWRVSSKLGCWRRPQHVVVHRGHQRTTMVACRPRSTIQHWLSCHQAARSRRRYM